MINAKETKTLKDWNSLVEKNWNHWQYYKDMINFSLQKSANSRLTRYLYPFFYQERILKRIFAENMQLLGDLTNEEVLQFETTNMGYLFKNLYNHFKNHEPPWMKYYHWTIYTSAFFVGYSAYKANSPKKWWVLTPLGFVLGFSAVLERLTIIQLGCLVDFTQWAIEKRKAEVWAEQRIIKVPFLINFSELECGIFDIVLEEKFKEFNSS